MVREICMIENFIIPSLNNEKFGHLLEWVDIKQQIFKVFWSHKSCRTWTKKNFAVFLEWDRIKGRTNHSEPEFFTKSKGRFRAALNRLSQVTELRSDIVGYKMYQLTLTPDAISSPCHVPETLVLISPSWDCSLYDSEIQFDQINDDKNSSNINSPAPICQNTINYFEHLPKEFSFNLDDINGQFIMSDSIQMELNSDYLALSDDNGSNISDEFLNEMLKEDSTLTDECFSIPVDA